MILSKIHLYYIQFKFLLRNSPKYYWAKLLSFLHLHTYRLVPHPKNVLIIGGSFAGFELARKLAHSLPTGHRVLMIEPNSHFNYTFNFPRYSVLQGREHHAFIPYSGISANAPHGIFSHVRARAASIAPDAVILESGEAVPYAYLVLATGATQSPPAKLLANERKAACAELQGFQLKIRDADRIAVVGAGAVGVEIAADIRSFYPGKKVTLVHSGQRILPRFGEELQQFAVEKLGKLGVEVVTGQRPKILQGEVGKHRLQFKDGPVEEFDFVIPCTGQTPNSGVLADYAPEAVSASTGRVLVRPTMQIAGKMTSDHMFALGDVAETEGPKMARAALAQVHIVHGNLMAMIKGRKAKATYVPDLKMEGSLHLTLGRKDWVTWYQTSSGEETLIPGDDGKDDLHVEGAWKYFGGNMDEFGKLSNGLLEP
ncbi:pyridine nucleotide-disulfide oxidoreductase-like protein 1 [Elsinoe australis]|uniref:Pyridine nucleotide-disulfide oxidoreductase-like protein 1 n=1 Tax=Elsinoe australis TaxID=40998 RepID=A0A4U7B858_9PEZI|nr:pyridine nucleotide-disulfide oxidoreductase-like protein 1 [Elsinoe australis]